LPGRSKADRKNNKMERKFGANKFHKDPTGQKDGGAARIYR